MKYFHISLHAMGFTLISEMKQTVRVFFCFMSVAGILGEQLTFWQITDIHWDMKYSTSGNPNDMCHQDLLNKDYSHVANDTGFFGNFNCDAPWTLVNSSIMAMKKIYPKPDFIIWTGDNPPHFYKKIDEHDWQATYTAIRTITAFMRTQFPDTKIIPSIGNHDMYPKDLAREDEQFYIDHLTNGSWVGILSEEEKQTFYKGGYYAAQVHPKLRILTINTILYMDRNTMVNESEKDPCGQFGWLIQELELARKNGIKVIIAGHCPPGFSGSFPGKTLKTAFNKKLINISIQYKDVITTEIYGHYHRDMFLLMKDKGTPSTYGLIASSVTPWMNAEPTLRLYTYDTSKGFLTNYLQYYLNLTEANLREVMTPTVTNANNITVIDEWRILYNFTQAYDVPDISLDSVSKILRNIKSNNTVFEKFYSFYCGGFPQPECDSKCKNRLNCAMNKLVDEDFNQCLLKPCKLNNTRR